MASLQVDCYQLTKLSLRTGEGWSTPATRRVGNGPRSVPRVGLVPFPYRRDTLGPAGQFPTDRLGHRVPFSHPSLSPGGDPAKPCGDNPRTGRLPEEPFGYAVERAEFNATVVPNVQNVAIANVAPTTTQTSSGPIVLPRGHSRGWPSSFGTRHPCSTRHPAGTTHPSSATTLAYPI